MLHVGLFELGQPALNKALRLTMVHKCFAKLQCMASSVYCLHGFTLLNCYRFVRLTKFSDNRSVIECDYHLINWNIPNYKAVKTGML